MRKVLGDLVGEKSKEGLLAMKQGLKQIPAPAADLASMVNAIDALLEIAD